METSMERAFTQHLSALKRLGKIERQELRSALTTDVNREQFCTCIEAIIAAHAEADDDVLEDLFIFGAQIADIWTETEIALEVEQITKALGAFSAGFNGRDFTDVFSGRLMRELQEQWTSNLPRKQDAQPLPQAKDITVRNIKDLIDNKPNPTKQKTARKNAPKLIKRAHPVVVQKSAAYSATA